MHDKLAELIRIPSVSDDIDQVHRALAFVLQLGEELGFETRTCADGQVGVIEWITSGTDISSSQAAGANANACAETLGILCHVDVVPPGPQDEWNTKPFEPVIKDGRMYGRGTLDDKGMVIATLFAMKAARDRGGQAGSGQPSKNVRLIIGTQEEVNWVDMDQYVKTEPLPDYGFTPDGEFPIQNIEKGIADYEFEFDADGCEINAGTAINSIPSKASVRLPNGETFEAAGKTCHSSEPDRGDNAFFNLGKVLAAREAAGAAAETAHEAAVDTAAARAAQIISAFEKAFGDGIGKSLPIYKETEYYEGEWVHRNTFAPTIVRTVNNKITVGTDVRFAYGTAPEDITRCMENFAKSLNGTVKPIEIMPAIFIPQNKPFLKAFAKAYEAITGTKNEFTLASGGSYAKAMPNIASWGPIFPGEEDTCHEPNEYINLQSLKKCFEIFTEAISEIVFSEKSFK